MKKFFAVSISLLMLSACYSLSQKELLHLDNIANDTTVLKDSNIQTKNDICTKNGFILDVKEFKRPDNMNNCQGTDKDKSYKLTENDLSRARARIYDLCKKAQTTYPENYDNTKNLTVTDHIAKSVYKSDRTELINDSSCGCFAIEFTNISNESWCGRKYLIQLSKDKYLGMPKLYTNDWVRSTSDPIGDIIKYSSEQCFIDQNKVIKEAQTNKKEHEMAKERSKKYKECMNGAHKYGYGSFELNNLHCSCVANLLVQGFSNLDAGKECKNRINQIITFGVF